MQAYSETWAAGLDPLGLGARLRGQRLAALLATAARHSPLYRRRVASARDLQGVEPVTKAELMREFDTWCTDWRITRSGVDAFIADPSRVADGWLDRYLVWTSSGTSGCPGIYVQDSASLAAYDAMDSLRLRGSAAAQPGLGLWGLGRRFAFVGATGGHFAGHVSLERLRCIVPPALAPAVDVISVLDPLPQVAARLQALQPGVLITYPSCAAALAQMQLGQREGQVDGPLRISPTEVWLGGEQLSAAQRSLVTRAFGCKVRNAYGASEFYSIAFECAEGSLHVNDDWVILEALDAQLRPVPAGTLSHTTLLTNLANHTQPLLRYQLDDRIRFVPGACACGCRFPVIEVQGRADDTLSLPGRRGQRVTILPLALETVIEEEAQVTQFQVLCHPGGRLELRLDAQPDARNDTQLMASNDINTAAQERCRAVIAAFLLRHGVTAAAVEVSCDAPVCQPGGKLRRVLNVGN